MAKQHPAARVPEPWHPQPWTGGPRYYLLVDEITARALAEGAVTASLQVQASLLVNFVYESKPSEPSHA